MSEILQKLNTIFGDVFEDDTLDVNRNTTAADIAGWDSLMHVTLMVNVERAFGVRFRSAEVAALKNVGELEDLVSKYTKPA